MIHDFSRHILAWFALYGRDLPWRHTRDPYAIWLSEVILQQTRIQQGLAYWERFMQRWPRVEDLAAASEDEVLRLWQGLGYYSRARNLHTAARQIVSRGGFPETLEGIRSLRGVGPYTAAAIGSLAFGLPVAVVDGNVYRVLARHFGIETPINSTEGQHEFAALAQDLLPQTQAAAFNQGMMDFGAVQCTPQAPHCESCPLAETCVALREDRVGELPRKERQLKVVTRRMTYIYIRYKGTTAFRRRPAGDIWQGLWEPVNADTLSPQQLSSLMALSPLMLVKEMKHVLTHRCLLCDGYMLDVEQKPELPEDYVWLPETDLDTYGKPRLVEKLLNLLPSSH